MMAAKRRGEAVKAWASDGDEEVRRGTNGRPQRRATKPGGWTKRRCAVFLDHLAATCNVTASAAAAGLHWSGAYALRRRDPEFAEQWQAALAAGYDALETMLVARAANVRPAREGHSRDPDEAAQAPDPESIDTGLALHLLALHKAPLKGRANAGGPRPRRASKEDLIAAIMKQLTVLGRRLKAKDEK
jgi:hypothetical protein